MCDPLTIAGIALTAGSTVANSMAANKVKKARASVMAAERTRQAAFDQEAAALNATSQNRYQDFGGQQEQKAQELGDYFAQQDVAEEAPGLKETLPTGSTDVVVQEQAAEQDKAKAFTNDQGMRLGDLRAFGDVLGGISRKQADDASRIGQIGGFKQGSSGIVPYELDVANEKGNKLKMLGDVLNIAGTVATGAGLSGGNLFGGSKMGADVINTTAGPWGAPMMPINVGAGPWGAAFGSAGVPIPRPRPNIGTTIGDLYGSTGRR